MSGYRNKGKKTKYSGVTFKSRLEAEWARTFDLIGLTDWVYEEREYQIDMFKRYTPDFTVMVDGGLVLVEVKPTWEMASEDARMQALSRIVPQVCVAVNGNPIFHHANGDIEMWIDTCRACHFYDGEVLHFWDSSLTRAEMFVEWLRRMQRQWGDLR